MKKYAVFKPLGQMHTSSLSALLAVSLIALMSVIFFPGSALAATDNCSDCHHIDFQTNLVDRNAVCLICHNGHTTWNSPDSFNADFTTIHVTTYHKGGDDSPTTERKTGCWICHYTNLTSTVRRVWCKTCHTSVAHENHGGTAGVLDYATDGQTGVAGDSHGYIQRNITCINSNCHGNYPTIVRKPSCSNCHDNPHGVFPGGSRDEAGVKVTPNTNPSYSDIAVKWLYQSGDTLKKSLDGLNWTNLDIGSPAPGSWYTYTDAGILNWTIVYYKITHSDGSERYFPVYPPGNNAHTNYLDNTQLCANCHVTHSAEQPRLLKESTIEDLCRTCHGLANTGSRYNVDTGEVVVAGTIDENGLITATGYVRANGGAFGIESGGKRYAGNHANTWNGAEVTSAHTVSSSTASIAPGGGHNYITLTCTSCHHSHPKNNSYRLLVTAQPYLGVEAFAVNTTATEERVNYLKNMNVGCGCHRQFNVGQDAGHVAESTYFRHAVGVAIRGEHAGINPITNTQWSLTTTLPTEYYVYSGGAWQTAGTLTGAPPVQYVENGAVSCMTCHYAHGTTATGFNQSAYDINGDSLVNGNDVSTMLKRQSNDTACQDCHQR